VEGHLTSGAGVTYLYDGDGKRVLKSSSGSPYKLYWYGTGSDVLDETDQNGNLTNEHVFSGGKRIARLDSSGNIFFYFADHLGTSRTILQAGQTGFCYDADFYPFGGEIKYTETCSQNYKFTGKERDTESNLDNFGARYNISRLGRFMSPDLFTVTLGRVADPQQLNLYAYVRNNPLTHVDPAGMIIDDAECLEDKKHCGNDWQKVQAIANQQRNGTYTHPELQKILSTLQSDPRTFVLKNSKLPSDEAGKFTTMTYNADRTDFTTATLQLDFGKIKGMTSGSDAEYVPGFKEYGVSSVVKTINI
jgi:RHS repeat-associated protein